MIALLAAALTLAPDFAPDSNAWNGLGYIETTAREARVELEVADTLDWSTATREQVLFLILPGAGIDVAELRAFVMDGGHAVVALDVGADDRVAREFSVSLSDEPTIHSDYHRDHPAFPRLTPPDEERGFLWFNVERMVLNHPGALTTGAVSGRRNRPHVQIPFAEPGQAFAVEAVAGDGSLLFLSDASVLINDMQRNAYGDKQFVANAMRYFCEEQCRVRLVLPDAASTGHYQPRGGSGLGGLERMFTLAVDAIDVTIGELGEWLGRPETLFAIEVALLAALLFGAALLPWPGAPRRFAWQPISDVVPTEAELRARALSTARSRADFSSAALALERRLEAHSAGRMGAVAQSEAALRCADTFNKVRAARADGPGGEFRLDHEQFEVLWSDYQAALEAIGRSHD